MLRARSRLRRRQAFTLVEVLIVITLLALAATGTTMALGALTRTNLRSACMKLVAASRFSYNRAIVRGTTVRLRIDADKHTLELEEAHGRVVLARADDPRRQELDDSEEDTAAVDPWQAARAGLEETFEPSFGGSPFGPLRGREGEVLAQYKSQPLGTEVQVVRMLLPHEPQPREQGKGAIYFFPNGTTEHAVVQLVHKKDRDTVYSVEVHPLTGRAKVHNEPYEPRELGEDASEVEDPG